LTIRRKPRAALSSFMDRTFLLSRPPCSRDTLMPKNVSPDSSSGLLEVTLLCWSVIRLMITVQVGLAVEMFKALGVGVHLQVGRAGVAIVRGLICLERL